MVEEMSHGFHAQPLTCDAKAGTMGRSSPVRSRRASLKTCRIGNSVNNPIASTTHKTISWVNVHFAN